jgi:hypothetical protein
LPDGASPPEARSVNAAYAAFHRPRFAFLIDILRPLAARPGVRILDVGPSPLTPLIARGLGAPVESLGLEPEDARPGHRHHSFDLNDAQFPERWRTDARARIEPVRAHSDRPLQPHCGTRPKFLPGAVDGARRHLDIAGSKRASCVIRNIGKTFVVD